MKKILPIYWSQVKGVYSWFSKNSPFILSINMHAYAGEHLISVAIPEICCLIWQSDSKKLIFKTKYVILTNSVLRVRFCLLLLSSSLKALGPTL